MDLKVFEQKIFSQNGDKIYRLPRYNGGPNGGHWHDVKNRQYITFEEACNI
jgi:hypothetical protein